MTNNKLTPERIDVARALIKNHIEMLEHELDILPDEEIYADVTREEIEHHETALAALELAEQLRWRKPEEADGGSSRIVIVARRNGKTGRIRYAERTEGLIKFSYNVVGFIRIPEWEAQHGQD